MEQTTVHYDEEGEPTHIVRTIFPLKDWAILIIAILSIPLGGAFYDSDTLFMQILGGILVVLGCGMMFRFAWQGLKQWPIFQK